MRIKICATPGCPNDTTSTYCPAHAPKPWEGSTRRQRIGKSGWEQQRRNRKTIEKHRGICHVCGAPGATQVDHVIPLARGGSDHEDNRRPIHPNPCHKRKTAREAQGGDH